MTTCAKLMALSKRMKDDAKAVEAAEVLTKRETQAKELDDNVLSSDADVSVVQLFPTKFVVGKSNTCSPKPKPFVRAPFNWKAIEPILPSNRGLAKTPLDDGVTAKKIIVLPTKRPVRKMKSKAQTNDEDNSLGSCRAVVKNDSDWDPSTPKKH